MDINQKKQHWLKVFEQQKQSGLTIAKFCKNNTINVSTFYTWKKRLTEDEFTSKNKQSHQLVPLFVSDSLAPSTITLTMPNGLELAFNEQVSPDRLASFIKAMQ